MKKITFLCQRTLYAYVYTDKLNGTSEDDIKKSISLEMKSDDVNWTTNVFNGEDEIEVVKEIDRAFVS